MNNIHIADSTILSMYFIAMLTTKIDTHNLIMLGTKQRDEYAHAHIHVHVHVHVLTTQGNIALFVEERSLTVQGMKNKQRVATSNDLHTRLMPHITVYRYYCHCPHSNTWQHHHNTIYRLLKEWSAHTGDCTKEGLARCLHQADKRLQHIGQILQVTA